jgi:hypothetical protein
MIAPTGNANFDALALAAERTRQAAEAVATTQAQMTAAAQAYFAAIVAAGAATNVSVSSAAVALTDPGAP